MGRERQAEQDAAIAAVTDVLDTIDEEGREPDLWEKTALANAINAVFRGLYGLAQTNAALAATPAAERSPRAQLSSDPIVTQITIDKARIALAEAALSLVERPIFGTISLR